MNTGLSIFLRVVGVLLFMRCLKLMEKNATLILSLYKMRDTSA